ncbi:M23 family metallopeptidase [Agromyces mediolanus]|uniref:murein hydrolase activator EnvC family protein n=1 Tax=Agromyces mediolanus TaxID=41986 RepID=UPI003839C010
MARPRVIARFLLLLPTVLVLLLPSPPSRAAPGTAAAARPSAAAASAAGPAAAAAVVVGPVAAVAADPGTADTVAETPTAGWRWPVDPPATIVAPFRAPPTPYAPGHRGIDLAAREHDAVRAPADGTVSFAGMVAGRPVVAVDHGDGYVSAVEPVSATVAAGSAVAAGEALGTAASGGHCDGGCVHFGVRLHGEYVSPLLLLEAPPRSVLLPVG